MALPPGFLEDLKSRVSLARVVGRKVAWDPRKSNAARGDWWAPCPFHQEKTASFHVDDVKGFYHCFGCHAKGDVVSFVRETDNIGFMEAVEMLAREAGLTMPSRDPAAAARASAERGLAEAMEAAVQFYRLQLNSARAAEARVYLDRRGLMVSARERFEIGFAPDSRSALQEHLKAKGFSPDILAEAGLTGAPTGGGTPYDRFRGRIMFPIRDSRGRAIAFGARSLRSDQQPKYLNSPETPLFDKGRSLYNIGPARSAAGRAGTVIVVEGYMDVIALAEAGLEHVVAPLGTAVTAAQLELLWRMAPEPVVALDGDKAGRSAGQRLIGLALPLLTAGRSLRFVTLPAGRDPDDIVRSGGAGAMEALVAGSRSMLDLLWEREVSGATFDSPERRAALDARLRTLVGRIADKALRAHYLAEIRTRSYALFSPRAKKRQPDRRGPRAPAGREGAALPVTRASLLASAAQGAAAEARVRESAILAGCLNHPDIARSFEDRLEKLGFLCPDLAEVRDALLFALVTSLNVPGQARSLSGAVSARLGRDVLEELTAVGQIGANPHLGPRAREDFARRALDEELTRQAALIGCQAETKEAQVEMTSSSSEHITNRLRHATDAQHDSYTSPLSDDGGVDQSEHAEFLKFLETVEAQQRTRKTRRH